MKVKKRNKTHGRLDYSSLRTLRLGFSSNSSGVYIAESMIGETTMPMAEGHLKTPASSIVMTASLSKGEMGNLWVFSRYLFLLQPGSSPSFLHQPQVFHHPVVLVRLSGHSV
jgi:hypothetical protein